MATEAWHERTLDAFLRGLRRATGNPGGGAAGGIVAAIGAALGTMVCNYTPDEPRARERALALGLLGDRLVAAAAADAEASERLGAALALSDSPDRSAAVFSAAADACAASAALGELALTVAQELRTVADVGNRHLMSDLAVAADITAAGLGAAATNLRGGLELAAAHGDPAALEASYRALVASLLAARTDARALADRLGEP
ncbi:cyclodeaminase/cyclohydrolase family protein [Microbacterium sp. SORGH_AS_0862]|uniref:cyclodeaminase/cyclohydrolase family protein n=1 Tax=Microbacterium sp. SORGH_AS_0862 TaxID=3041789 RepID=UPI00278D8408|nr:cyclodeaminase/cyclohydrolase family protein [Microbacterium sp. SORGH_AS_0862]MDQ1203780.1 formiminotetrahydrofolate cyclodeaminase [Microbacterium sp. SORGH_AS_0862]